MAAILLASCAKPVTDPYAVAPTYDRWQVTVARQPGAVFDAAMRVLTDSSYRIANAQKDAGLIRTENRKASDVQRGGQQLKTMLGSDYPVKLSLVVSPVGSDSTRLSLSGEYTLENISRSAPIDARSGEWKLVSGIGQAILTAIR